MKTQGILAMSESQPQDLYNNWQNNLDRKYVQGNVVEF